MTTHTDTPGYSGPQLHRRTLARGAAWSVPVVAATAAAPAYAASPCSLAPQTVSTTSVVTVAPLQGFSRASATSAQWRTQDPDGAAPTFAQVAIDMAASTTTANILHGFTAATDLNLTPFTASTVTGITINQRPATTTSARGSANRTITALTFSQPVYNLTFTVADISNSGNAAVTPPTVRFWDAVWLEGPAFTVVDRQPRVSGSGTSLTDPFTPPQLFDNNDVTDDWNITVRYAGPVTRINVHYWSANTTPPLPSGFVDQRGGQGITLSNMTMQVRAVGC